MCKRLLISSFEVQEVQDNARQRKTKLSHRRHARPITTGHLLRHGANPFSDITSFSST